MLDSNPSSTPSSSSGSPPMGNPKLEGLNLPESIKAKAAELLRDIEGVPLRQRAALEAKFWNHASGLGLGFSHRDLMSMILDCTHQQVEIYHMLHNAPLAAAPLWDRMEGEERMSHHTAGKLLRAARKEAAASGGQISLEVAVIDVLREYDKNPGSKTPGGHIVRRKQITRLPKIDDLHVKPKKAKKYDPDSDGHRIFYANLREDIASFVAPRLGGTDPIIAEQIWKDFELGLKVLLDDFGIKVSRARSNNADADVNRKQIVEACRHLHMDPPKPGLPIDLASARAQKKKMAKLYHPDKVGGSEATRPQYEAVIEAFLVAEKYAEKFGSL